MTSCTLRESETIQELRAFLTRMFTQLSQGISDSSIVDRDRQDSLFINAGSSEYSMSQGTSIESDDEDSVKDSEVIMMRTRRDPGRKRYLQPMSIHPASVLGETPPYASTTDNSGYSNDNFDNYFGQKDIPTNNLMTWVPLTEPTLNGSSRQPTPAYNFLLLAIFQKLSIIHPILGEVIEADSLDWLYSWVPSDDIYQYGRLWRTEEYNRILVSDQYRRLITEDEGIRRLALMEVERAVNQRFAAFFRRLRINHQFGWTPTLGEEEGPVAPYTTFEGFQRIMVIDTERDPEGSVTRLNAILHHLTSRGLFPQADLLPSVIPREAAPETETVWAREQVASAVIVALGETDNLEETILLLGQWLEYIRIQDEMNDQHPYEDEDEDRYEINHDEFQYIYEYRYEYRYEYEYQYEDEDEAEVEDEENAIVPILSDEEAFDIAYGRQGP